MSMQNYEIIRKLGQGSYGSVYLARQRDSGRQCVMKRMVLRSLNSKERESAFQEARVLRDLSHPNIVAYIDTQATASKLYLFMQFCDGGDLEQRLAKLKETGGAVAQSQALDWFVQMALALQYLHSRRILHRDLKTANVFLTRRDIVKLGDFGVSRVLSATAELARTFVGTPYYLSPELLNNQPYGQPSDVWALGCIFHEIATLEHPYEATTFPSLAFKIINEDVRPLASYPAAQGMEPELQRLVDLMLTKDHMQRATLAQVLNEGVVQRRMLAFVQEAEAAHPRDNPPSTPSRAAAADVAAAATTDAAAAAAAAAASIAPTQRGAPLPARPAQPAPAPALAPRPTCAPAPAPAAPGRPLSRPASASTPAATQAAQPAQPAQVEVPPAAPTPHKRGSNRKAAVAAAAAAGGARGVGARGGYARQAEPRRPEELRAQIALEQQRLQRMQAPAVAVPPVVPPPPPPPAGAPALQVDAALQAARAQAETLRSAAAPALAADAAASAASAASAAAGAAGAAGAADAAGAAGVAPCTRSLAQWTECFGDALQPPLAGSAGASAAAPLAKTVGYDEEEDEEYAHYTPFTPHRTPPLHTLHTLAHPRTLLHTLTHPSVWGRHLLTTCLRCDRQVRARLRSRQRCYGGGGGGAGGGGAGGGGRGRSGR